MPGNDDELASSKWWSSTRAAGARRYGSQRASAEGLDADVTAHLEWLDDLMFAAIDGDAAALEAAAGAWKAARKELGKDIIEESRRQYLRRAQSVWHELRTQPNHPPHKVFAAIEIISLLAEKSW